MSDLIIVESPSKIHTVKRTLGAGYDVVACVGHVRDLPKSKIGVDVENGFEPTYVDIKGKENVIKDIKKLAKKSEHVYFATDPDREGEAISWHLATILGLDPEKANRVTFNEITKTGVINGMENPRAIDIDLVNAQQARRILDRLVGYRLSPFVSQKIRRGLSAGRVQSVAVRLIVDRENEIRAFVPEEYWSLDAKFTAPSSRRVFGAAFYGDETGKVKITSKEQADSYLSRLEGAEYTVANVKKGTRKKNPAPPFITSTLQQEASRRLGFQARRTMKVAQELYEGVEVAGYGSMGLITYMRTDSLRISEEARSQGCEYIGNTFGKDYLPAKPVYFKSRANAQDGHEAIRPTVPSLTPETAKASLTPDQYKIYNLVWKRFMASLMAPCIQNTVKAEIEANGCLFSASGYTVKFDGYTVLYDDKTDEEESGKLPEINKGDVLKLKDLLGNQHFTQPPARFTEASLIKALEENGIGRPSTYASIITTIVSREYVKREGKQLRPTELGEAMTNLLKERFPQIVNVKFTAGMESSLDEVGEGKEDYIALLHKFYDEFEKTLKKAKADMEGVKIQLQEDQTDIPCELCGRNMVIKVGRYGKFLACPGYPDCKNTKPLVFETAAKCPVCGGTVIQKKTKRGYAFYGCGNYPQCNFMTWDEPTEENCPDCGKSLFKKRGGIVHCLNEGCGFSKTVSRRKKTTEKADEKE